METFNLERCLECFLNHSRLIKPCWCHFKVKSKCRPRHCSIHSRTSAAVATIDSPWPASPMMYELARLTSCRQSFHRNRKRLLWRCLRWWIVTDKKSHVVCTGLTWVLTIYVSFLFIYFFFIYPFYYYVPYDFDNKRSKRFVQSRCLCPVFTQ